MNPQVYTNDNPKSKSTEGESHGVASLFVVRVSFGQHPHPWEGLCEGDDLNAVHGGHHYDDNHDNACEADDRNAVHDGHHNDDNDDNDGHHNDDNGDNARKPETLEHDDPIP